MIKNWSGVLAVALAAASLGCRAEAAGPEPLQGVVELDERVLAFEVAGRLRTVGVARGAAVKAGAPVATLNDSLDRPTREARAEDLHAAEAQLALLKAGSRPEDVRATEVQLAAAREVEALVRKNLARQRVLVDAGTIGAAATDDLEAQLARAEGERQSLEQRLRVQKLGARPQELDVAAARVAGAKQALAAADQRLARFALAAPVDGVVLDVHQGPGELCAAGTPVATIGDVAHPFVDVFVPQGALSGVTVGLPASVRVDSELEPLHGQIEDVGRRTEFTPRYLFSPRERPNLVVRVRVRVDDPAQKLHAGVPAFVTLDHATPAAPAPIAR
jgi:HlyD family secretion protein